MDLAPAVRSLDDGHGPNRLLHDRKVAGLGLQVLCCGRDCQYDRAHEKGNFLGDRRPVHPVCDGYPAGMAEWIYQGMAAGRSVGSITFSPGIAFLTKGPHAAVFFYVTVGAYLLFRKRISFFFSIAHAMGIISAVVVLIVYLRAILREISCSAYLDMWKTQITSRGDTSHGQNFLKHLVDFPLDAVLSFMPWVLLAVPVLLHRGLRQHARSLLRNELVIYSLIMITANFPLYWLLPHTYVRYILPAGPFIAIILAALMATYASALRELLQEQARLLKALRGAAMLVCLAALLIAGVAWATGMHFTFSIAAAVMLIVVSSGFIVLRPAGISLRILVMIIVF